MEIFDLLSGGRWNLDLFSNSLGIVAYVLQALALYTIAKRRQINRPWLAWIPVANLWLLGAISDQYQEVAKGKQKSRRKILLGLSIAEIVLTVLCLILFVIVVLSMFYGSGAAVPELYSAATEDYDLIESMTGMLGMLLAGAGVLLLCLLPVLILAVVLAVFRWLAIWDLFKSCDPQNALVYFLVSLLLGLFAVSGLESVFMLVCMNKDEGMIQSGPQTDIPPQEPWNNPEN